MDSWTHTVFHNCSVSDVRTCLAVDSSWHFSWPRSNFEMSFLCLGVYGTSVKTCELEFSGLEENSRGNGRVLSFKNFPITNVFIDTEDLSVGTLVIWAVKYFRRFGPWVWRKLREALTNSFHSIFLFMYEPVVMYRRETWTVKKAERQRIDAFELWCWRRLLRVPWTARRSNQSILKEISLGFLWKEWC